MSRYRHVRSAAALFADIDGQPPPREDLALAFRCLWRATLGVELWPAHLRAQVELFQPTMFRYGNFALTATRMSDEEAREAVRVIRSLAAEAEQSGEPF